MVWVLAACSHCCYKCSCGHLAWIYNFTYFSILLFFSFCLLKYICLFSPSLDGATGCVCSLSPWQVSRSSIPMALRLCTILPCLSSLLGPKCLELHLSQPCPAQPSTSPEQTPSSHRCTCQTHAQGHWGWALTQLWDQGQGGYLFCCSGCEEQSHR